MISGHWCWYVKDKSVSDAKLKISLTVTNEPYSLYLVENVLAKTDHLYRQPTELLAAYEAGIFG